MKPKEEESYYEFRDSYDIVMEAEKRESEGEPKERTRKRGNRGGKDKSEEDRKRHREILKRRDDEDRKQQSGKLYQR